MMSKYYVEVTRTSYARQTLEIEAKSANQAKDLAMERAPDEEFSTYDYEYEVSSVELAKAKVA
jgi:hypothetical protein